MQESVPSPTFSFLLIILLLDLSRHNEFALGIDGKVLSEALIIAI